MELRTPTKLTEEQIREFQELTKRLQGIELTKEEAERDGIDLIRYIAAIIEGDI